VSRGAGTEPRLSSISDDLDQHTLPAPAVKTRVPAIPAGPKDLLPGAKDFDELSRVVEPPLCDRHDHLTAHHPSFQMGIGVVPSTPPLDTLGGRLRTGLAGAVVLVAADRLVGGESFTGEVFFTLARLYP
jgi:hypothetical protein